MELLCVCLLAECKWFDLILKFRRRNKFCNPAKCFKSQELAKSLKKWQFWKKQVVFKALLIFKRI